MYLYKFYFLSNLEFCSLKTGRYFEVEELADVREEIVTHVELLEVGARLAAAQ